MNILKHFARTFIYPLVTAAGVERIFSSLSKNNKLILVYHGVMPQPNHKLSLNPIDLTQFTRHLQYLHRHFKIVPLEEIFDMYRNHHTPAKKTIALTFDDGYQNNYTRAYPLLRESKTPATIFVVTQEMGNENRITWYDYLDGVKQKIRVADIDLSQLGRGKCRNMDELKEIVKSLPIEQRQALFAQIKTLVSDDEWLPDYPSEYWQLMNATELRYIADSGLVEIGAHTEHHLNLGLIDTDSVQREVLTCKNTLEEIIQKEVKSIAFPDGSYDDSVKKICVAAGYKNLLAVDYRCESDCQDQNILPRAGISATTTFDANMIQINRSFAKEGF